MCVQSNEKTKAYLQNFKAVYITLTIHLIFAKYFDSKHISCDFHSFYLRIFLKRIVDKSQVSVKKLHFFYQIPVNKRMSQHFNFSSYNWH